MNTPQQEDMEDRCARPSEMVERVALAIHVVLVENLCDQAVCKFVNGCGCASDAAKAAIEAMRDACVAFVEADAAKYLSTADRLAEAGANLETVRLHEQAGAALECTALNLKTYLSPAQRSSNP